MLDAMNMISKTSFILLSLALSLTTSVGCRSTKAVPEVEGTPGRITESQIEFLRSRLDKIKPAKYKLKVIGSQTNPFMWKSDGRYEGVEFVLEGSPIDKGRRSGGDPWVFLTFMPQEYNGKPIPFEELPRDWQISPFPAKHIGRWHNSKVYGHRGFGYPLPKKGRLGVENIVKHLAIEID